MSGTALPLPLGSGVELVKPRRDLLLLVVLVGVGGVAFLVRLRMLTNGAGIAASDGYDDGVYFAAADALLHGRLPYKDFLLLHPPGIVLALTPFAALGAALGDPVGVAVGRLSFIGVGAANALLLGVLASRHSRAAAVTAAGVAAFWFPLAYSERSTLLEPLGSLLLLLSLVVARRGPGRACAVLAGAVAGLSIDVKVWYVVPVILIGVFAVRFRAVFLSGAAVAAAVVAMPFFVAAPGPMLREVVLDQLGRPRAGGADAILQRLMTIASIPRGFNAPLAEVVACLILGVVVIGVVGTWSVRWARPFIALTAASALVLLVGPSFFLHYAAFVAPWLILVIAIGGGVLITRLQSRSGRRLAALGVVLLLAAANAPAVLATRAEPQPVAELHAAMASRGGCILSDDPGLLANADLLTTVLERGCPLWPDVTGWTYDRDRMVVDGVSVPRASNTRWQRSAVAYLTSGDTFVLNRPATGLSTASRRRLDQLPVIARVGRLVVRSARS